MQNQNDMITDMEQELTLHEETKEQQSCIISELEDKMQRKKTKISDLKNQMSLLEDLQQQKIQQAQYEEANRVKSELMRNFNNEE